MTASCENTPLKEKLLLGCSPFFTSIFSINPIFHLKVPSLGMSRKGNGPRLDLKLNISPPPRPNPMRMESPRHRSMSISPSSSLTSMASSCVSSEVGSDETDQGQTHGYLSSPEPTSMVLVGCPCCLMYVMLSEDSPKCPKCNSTALLDFICDNKNSSNSTNNSKKN